MLCLQKVLNLLIIQLIYFLKILSGLNIPLYPESNDDLVAKHRETIGQIVGLEIKRTEEYPMSKVS